MKKLAALFALALASLALVACGGSSNSESSETSGGEAAGKEESGGAGSTVKIEADPGGEIAYATKSATAKAGQVTIDFNNPQSLPHDVKVEGPHGEELGGTEQVSEGSTSASVSLKPGTYHYYCSVPGHREAGMEGTLTVK
jgi:plastocyanin